MLWRSGFNPEGARTFDPFDELTGATYSGTRAFKDPIGGTHTSPAQRARVTIKRTSGLKVRHTHRTDKMPVPRWP